MGSPWLAIDNNFPTFTGSEGLKEQIRLIHDFLPTLIECLKYQLSNLGTNNWNATEMQNFQSDTTKELEDAMDTTDAELAQLILDLEKLNDRVGSIAERLADTETDLSYLEQWKQQLTEQIETMESELDDLSAEQDSVGQLLREDENGITLGKKGVTLSLVGTVYINGVLIES